MSRDTAGVPAWISVCDSSGINGGVHTEDRAARYRRRWKPQPLPALVNVNRASCVHACSMHAFTPCAIVPGAGCGSLLPGVRGGGPELAAVARAVESRRVARSRVCRRHGARRRTSPGEPRSPASAPRRRSCGATACSSRRRSAASPWPVARRIPGSPATTARWPSTRRPIGGSRADPDRSRSKVWLVVEAFRRSDGQRLWEYRTEATGPLPELHEKHNLATPTPVTDGQRVYAWFGNGQVVALDMDGRVVWTRHLGAEYSPFQAPLGPRQLAGAVRRSPDPAVRPPARRLSAGARRADGQAAVEGGPRRRAASRTARRWSCPGRTATSCSSTRRERIDVYDPATGEAAVARRRATADADSLRRLSRRPDLSEPRVSQQRLHGHPARRARRRHGDARRSGRRHPARPTCRRSCTTTGCST